MALVDVRLVHVDDHSDAVTLIFQRFRQLDEEDAQPPRLNLKLGGTLALPLALARKLK